MGTRLLTYEELREHGVPYGRRNLHKLELVGKFPKRVPIGPRRVAWVESEVDRYVSERIKSRLMKFGALGSSKEKGRPTRRPEKETDEEPI